MYEGSLTRLITFDNINLAFIFLQAPGQSLYPEVK